MRISRPCYDKFHRCPGWAGGGFQFPPVEKMVCPSGSIGFAYQRRGWKWRFTRCPKCQTLVLPYVTRWLDPSWLKRTLFKRPRIYR